MPTFSRPAAHSARTPTRQDVNDETAALPGLFAKVTKGERRRHNASGNGLGAALARLRADLLLLHADIDFVRVGDHAPPSRQCIHISRVKIRRKAS